MFDTEKALNKMLGNDYKEDKKMKPRIHNKRMRRTVNHAAGGMVLGYFIGAPGLGAAIGVVHANKDMGKKFIKYVDKK